MGDTYNNVGATGLVARSNHHCPVIMGDNIICGQLGGDETGVCGIYIGEPTVMRPTVVGPTPGVRYILYDGMNHPLLGQSLLDRATRPVAPTFV